MTLSNIKKYSILSIIFTFIISLVSYQKVQSSPIKYDVATANGKVLFRFTLNDAMSRINAKYSYDTDYQGQNTYVVVIDTGVQVDHPFLNDSVELEACFALICPNGTNQMIGPGAAKPVHWHGTHVAGIIAGSPGRVLAVVDCRGRGPCVIG